MTKLLKEKKGNVIALAVISIITAILSYGYVISNPTIGIDDTELERYVLKGWEPLFNRLTLVIPGLILRFDKYIPYLYDILGVIFIVAAAIVWLYVWFTVSKKRLHFLSCCLFVILFISSPLICETYIFYLHNGEGMAFLMIAVATWGFYRFVKDKRIKYLIISSLLVITAIGCYESMALVYAVAVLTVCFLDNKYSDGKYSLGLFAREFVACIVPMFLGIVLRSVISTALPKIINFDATGKILNAHSGSLKYWFLNNPIIIAKDLIYKFIARYVISGLYFKWVIVLVVLSVLYWAYIVYLCIRKKLIGALMLVVMYAMPWVLMIYQMEMTPYRAMQGLMMWIAVAGLILVEFVLEITDKKNSRTIGNIIVGCIAIVVLTGHVSDSYRYYKLDYDVYQSDLEYVTSIYDYLNEKHIDKPVVFVGKYEMPNELKERAYFLYDTEWYNRVSEMFNLKNTKAWYYYCDDYGYQLYDVGHVDPLSWACYANPGRENGEVYDFFEMNGMEIKQTEIPDWDEINKYRPDKTWPESGSVVTLDDCVVLRIGK